MNKKEAKSTQRAAHLKCALLMKTMCQGFTAVLKKRPSNERFCLIMLMLAFHLEILNNYMYYRNYYMYFRLILRFTMEYFTLFSSLVGLYLMTCQFVLVPLFSKVLKLRDATIALIGECRNNITRLLS